MKFLLWYTLWDICSIHGEWIELPKLEPTLKKEKLQKEATPPKRKVLENQQNKENSSVNIDVNLEKILLDVHKNLASEAHSTIEKKEDFLKREQKRLLADIWERSFMIWSKTGVEGRGHGSSIMTFPSLEGALMTISFLTFAVFLIKIVKQFIEGVKGGHGGNVYGVEMQGMQVVQPAKIIKHKRSPLKNKVKARKSGNDCPNPAQWYEKYLCIAGFL